MPILVPPLVRSIALLDPTCRPHGVTAEDHVISHMTRIKLFSIHTLLHSMWENLKADLKRLSYSLITELDNKNYSFTLAFLVLVDCQLVWYPR